jgi:hypothetical protein
VLRDFERVPRALAWLAICSCRDAVDAPAFRAPACHAARATEAEDGTDLGRLRAAERAAIARHMLPYDEVMSGKRPAYEGIVWVDGKDHGTLHGVVSEIGDHGAPSRRLELDGSADTRLTLHPATSHQRGAFVLALPSVALIECGDCIDLDARELPLTPTMRFDPLPNVRVELHRLRPAAIDIARAKALFRWLAASHADGAETVVTWPSEAYVVVERPPQVDARYDRCELSWRESPEVRIATSCPSTWTVRFATASTHLQCCTQPRYHGPPTSGYYPEDCIDVPPA